MQTYESIVVYADDPVVGQGKSKQVDQLVEDIDWNSLKSVVGHREKFNCCLPGECFPVEACQAVVVEVESAEGAWIPHHDVFQLWEPIVSQVKVLQLGQSTESLSFNLCYSIVLQVELGEWRQAGKVLPGDFSQTVEQFLESFLCTFSFNTEGFE